MITHPRSPLIFGGLAILGLGAYLYVTSPMPATLSESHDQIGRFSSLKDCSTCHAAEGLAAGCLGCHTEISGKSSYHQAILREGGASCIPCHGEHHGASFPLISSISWGGGTEEAFGHDHVSFDLHGKHDGLACEDCHEKKRDGPFVLDGFADYPRARTFLGLVQSCDRCHEDVHAGGLSGACDRCHDQEQFRPASLFDHDVHFALLGAHTDAPCQECHLLPEGEEALPFASVRGKICRECHDSPHRAPLGDACQECHPGTATLWSAGIARITPEVHALTGFHLEAPHHDVVCEKCHDPALAFLERYPGDRPSDACEGCHGDPHEGQFAGRYTDCLECHERHRFVPSRFDPGRHESVFPLAGAHTSVECASCHRDRRFVGVPRECSGCHEDPHDGQFAAAYPGCDACHDERGFLPASFDLARHAEVFPVEGAHVAVPCTGCHRRDDQTTIRRFVGTTSSCQGCHDDPHGGQFEREMTAGDCSSCHGDTPHTFSLRPFDHARTAGYALTGAHLQADCVDCHRQVDSRIHYRGTSSACASCHRDEHRGQFREKGGSVLCDRCHTSTDSWKTIRFDHSKHSRFPLEGLHAEVPCGGCHPEVEDSKGKSFTQYKPLGTDCEDCHAILPPEDR